MSVIGRLDKQVEDVLISPLGRKSRREAIEQEDEQTTPRGVVEGEDPEPTIKKRAENDALPVWLL